MHELMTLRDFLAEAWPPTEKIVDPWLPTSGISMLWGDRGGGKTLVTLGLALHIASGKTFLDMAIPKARRVVYVDGEMSAAEMKGRLEKLIEGMGPFCPAFENLAILSHEKFKSGIPDLSVAGPGRRLIENVVKEHNAELLVLDNLASLLQSGNESEAEDWASFSSWLLNFRRQHITTLLVHHAGKNGSQRGTSKREDHLNSSVKITTVDKGPPLQLMWEFTKVRSFSPGEPYQIEITFQKVDDKEIGAQLMLGFSIADEIAEVLEMRAEGLSVREIAKRTGQSKSAVHRKSQKGRA